ncbi:hypothetical protein [Aurantimonas sp. 22II-16-19i]|uniref:hypothetical protein n=1 Tax=Aurantimonas sp. 22II-16-19i TaxID=1317114 RepID=UPI00111BDC72|nr:hypothetical protein [Aurantimonas sp. 22II-16-19i]
MKFSVTRIFATVTSAILVVMSTSCADGFAQGSCLESSMERVDDTQYDKSESDSKEIIIKIGEEILQVPSGYFQMRPGHDMWNKSVIDQNDISSLVSWDRFSAAFWMPSLKWPEGYPVHSKMRNLCGSSKAQARRNKYIVEFRVLLPWGELNKNNSNFTTPSERLENGIKYGLNPPKVKITEFGILRYPRINGKKVDYFYKDVDLFELKLICSNDSGVPNPLCYGYVLYYEEGLGFFIRFPEAYLPEWRDNVEAVHSLLAKWRAKI